MAKGNLFLGTAYGSVGDVTLYRKSGEQTSRVRVRKIGNPKTENQAANRALLATLGVAYSYLRGIVDHSFQGLSKPSDNMYRFQHLNQGIARATGSVKFGGPDEGYNFNFKSENVLRPNPYAIARGTLPEIHVVSLKNGNYTDGFALQGQLATLIASSAATLTYDQVCSALGIERGSQLTFCTIADDTFTGVPDGNNHPLAYGNFHYARVILAPNSGDWTEPMFFVDGNNIELADPNIANEGIVTFKLAEGMVKIIVDYQEYPTAMGIIASNYKGGVWKRSNCDMLVADGYESSNTMSEVYMSYMQSEEQPSSNKYLNQSQAADAEPVIVSRDPAIASVMINGQTMRRGQNLKIEVDDISIQGICRYLKADESYLVNLVSDNDSHSESVENGEFSYSAVLNPNEAYRIQLINEDTSEVLDTYGSVTFDLPMAAKIESMTVGGMTASRGQQVTGSGNGTEYIEGAVSGLAEGKTYAIVTTSAGQKVGTGSVAITPTSEGNGTFGSPLVFPQTGTFYGISIIETGTTAAIDTFCQARSDSED